MNFTWKNSSEFLPSPEAHKNFIMETDMENCRFIHFLAKEEQCDFAKNFPGCRDLHHNFLNYLVLTSCSRIPLKLGIFVLFLGIILLLLLAVTNAFSYAPNLLCILHYMQLEEYNSGALVVALINTFPSLITRFMQSSSVDSELFFGYTIGSGVILSSLYYGIFIVIYPHTVEHTRFLVRDIVYNVPMLIYVCLVCAHKYINMIHPILWATAEVSFFIYCGIENQFIKLYSKSTSVEDQDIELQSEVYPNENTQMTDTSGRSSRQLWARAQMKLNAVRLMSINVPKTGPGVDSSTSSANAGLFSQFFYTLNPLKKERIREFKGCGRVLYFTITPFRFVIRLFVPLVDFKRTHHGWSKMLNTINIVSSTLLLNLVLKLDLYLYSCCFLFPSVLLALIVFGTSRTDSPPKYHHIFALHGIAMTWLISLMLVNEIIAICNALRVFFGWRKSTGGLTIIAFGITIEEMITNFTFAAMGFKVLAYGAFANAPFMTIILQISILLIVHHIQFGEEIEIIRDGAIGRIGIVFMALISVVSSVAILLTRCQFRRSIGIFKIICYFIFLLFVFLAEFEIIHPFGTDHSDSSALKELVFWA